jgi:hypothetical protein
MTDDEATEFLNNAWDADTLHGLYQVFEAEQYNGTRWEGKIDFGEINHQYAIIYNDDKDVIVQDKSNEIEFNASSYGEDEFRITIDQVLTENYCHGMDYDSYSRLHN